MSAADAGQGHWRSSRRVVVWLLAIWFVLTFGVSYFGRDLSRALPGWPFSFWVAAQGAPIIYLLLVCVYARLARRLEDAHGDAGAEGESKSKSPP